MTHITQPVQPVQHPDKPHGSWTVNWNTGVPPPRVESTPRAEEQTAQDEPQGRTRQRQELSLGLEVVKDAVNSYIAVLWEYVPSR